MFPFLNEYLLMWTVCWRMHVLLSEYKKTRSIHPPSLSWGMGYDLSLYCHWDVTNSSTSHLAFIKDFYGYPKQPANPSQSPQKYRNRDLDSRRALVNLPEPGLDSLKQTRGALKSCLRTHGIWVQNNNNSKIPVEVTTDPLWDSSYSTT